MFEKIDPRDTRRSNLQSLVEKHGQATVAKLTGKPDRQIADILSKRKTFGEKVARSMESSWKEKTGESLDLDSPVQTRNVGLNEASDLPIDTEQNAIETPGVANKLYELYRRSDSARQAIVDVVLGGSENAPSWMSRGTLSTLNGLIDTAKEQAAVPDTTKKSAAS